MKTVAEFEEISYLSEGAAGAFYEVPAALRTLAVDVGIPLRQINKMIADGTLPVRRVLFDDRWQRVITSEDVVAVIKALSRTGKGAGKVGSTLKIIKGSRGNVPEQQSIKRTHQGHGKAPT